MAAFRIFKGESEPTRYTGSSGDYFIDTRRWMVYGPKTGGSWPPGKAIWPDGVPRALPPRTPTDDVPLAAGGKTLTTDSGAVLAGDLRPDPK